MSQPSYAIDSLAPSAVHLLRIGEPEAYARLVVAPGERGPVEARDVLESLKPADVVRGGVADHNAGACAVAALWLWHDFLDPAHTIVQSIESPLGSLWHAVLHRREGDFSNAKYWYRRAGPHASASALATRVNDLTQAALADKSLLRVSAAGWNPAAFVDLCEAVHATPGDPRYVAAQAIQRAEWQLLFAASVRDATTAS